MRMTANVKKAFHVLAEAEESLRALIRESLEEDEYGEVAVIAGVAEELSQAIAILETPPPPNTGPNPSSELFGHPAAYPRFERNGYGLVKTGWSKKNREEYVHRAPKDVVWALARMLREHIGPENRFTASGIFSLLEERGEEIPAYQVYVCLAWLKSAGAVTGNGRAGYRTDPAKLSDEGMDVLWQSLKEER